MCAYYSYHLILKSNSATKVSEIEILWAFTSSILKILAFSISKSHFITFNISFYNTLNIELLFFLQLHLNIISLLFFYSFFVFIFFIISPSRSHCLSLPLSLSVSLSQPSNPTYRWPLATTIPTTITMIRDPRRSSRWSIPTTLIKLMIHAGQLNDPRWSRWWSTNPDPWT